MLPVLDFPSEYLDELSCTSKNPGEYVVKDLHEQYINPHFSLMVKCKLFDGLKLTNEIINDILLFLLNILIDLSLLYHFNKDIAHKMKMRPQNADKSDLIKSKKNINRMVLISGLVFFFSSCPQFVILLLAIVWRDSALRRLCFFNFKYICSLLKDLAQFFSVFTMMFQFYIFLIFNKNFRESFNDRWSVFKQRFKK